MIITDIILAIIGEVALTNDEKINKIRIKNLARLGELTVDLVDTLVHIATSKEYPFDENVKKMRKLAYDDLVTIKQYIENMIE